MGWFRKQAPQPVDEISKPVVPVSPTLLDHEERLLRVEMRVKAFDLEIEDFTAKVTAAARRAYKREADVERREAKEEPALDRAGRKKQILNQLRTQRGG
jgi:hypothetical protein